MSYSEKCFRVSKLLNQLYYKGKNFCEQVLKKGKKKHTTYLKVVLTNTRH